MPNYKEPAKMPSEEVQEYIMNPGKWISDLKDEIKELKEEIKRKDEALKLSEEDRQKIIDNAHRALRLHVSRAQGQMLTERDSIEAYVIFETLAYIKSRLIEEVSDD